MFTPPDGPHIRQKIFRYPTGKTLVDFGHNLVGCLRFDRDGHSRTKTTIRHAEVLDEDEIGVRPLRSVKATDFFVLNGKDSQTWEPSFTYHGFRFAEFTGWSNTMTLDGEHFTTIVVHSDMERTWYFEYSNSLSNRFHENVIWSTIATYLSVPIDCAQRDERLGWNVDAHVFTGYCNG